MKEDLGEVFPNKVYYVKSDKDNTVLVALDLFMQGNAVSWFDTRKTRIMEIEEILIKEPSKFSFLRKSSDRETYTFIPMTVDIYNAYVKDKLFSPEEFTDLKSLEDAFEATKKN